MGAYASAREMAEWPTGRIYSASEETTRQGRRREGQARFRVRRRRRTEKAELVADARVRHLYDVQRLEDARNDVNGEIERERRRERRREREGVGEAPPHQQLHRALENPPQRPARA